MLTVSLPKNTLPYCNRLCCWCRLSGCHVCLSDALLTFKSPGWAIARRSPLGISCRYSPGWSRFFLVFPVSLGPHKKRLNEGDLFTTAIRFRYFPVCSAFAFFIYLEQIASTFAFSAASAGCSNTREFRNIQLYSTLFVRRNSSYFFVCISVPLYLVAASMCEL